MRFLLKNPSYALLLISQTISWFGDYVYTIALQWLVLEMGGGAAELSIAALCSIVPQIVFGPLVGPLVDRWKKKTILIATDMIRGTVLLLFYLLIATDVNAFLLVYVACFLLSVAEVFFSPAFFVIIPSILPKEDIGRANAIQSSTHSTVTILGLGVAGSLIAWLGTESSILINAISFFLCALTLLFVKTRQSESESAPNENAARTPYLQELKEGFRYVWLQPMILFVCLFAVVLNIGSSPLNVLQPILVNDVLQAGPNALGMFGIAATLGGLTMGLLLTRYKKYAGQGIVFLLAGILQGVMVAVLGLSTHLTLSVAALYVAGMTFAAINIPFFSILQTQVEQAYMGRVVSIVVTLSTAATPIATAACGWLATQMGPAPVYVYGGSLSVLVGMVLLLQPRFRAMVRASTPAPPSA